MWVVNQLIFQKPLKEFTRKPNQESQVGSQPRENTLWANGTGTVTAPSTHQLPPEAHSPITNTHSATYNSITSAKCPRWTNNYDPLPPPDCLLCCVCAKNTNGDSLPLLQPARRPNSRYRRKEQTITPAQRCFSSPKPMLQRAF